MRYHLLIAFLFVLSTGCTTLSKPPVAVAPNSDTVTQLLYQQHNDWRGTPYRLGGSSKRGIDCSAFTQVTYRQQFGLPLPRTTEQQAEYGQQVSRSEMVSGDLVLFKTGFSVRHVGIYVGNGQFLHASTSRGVMISRLDNPYWKKHYWKVVRPDSMARVQGLASY